VVLDGDVDCHVRRLPLRLQCPPVPARRQRPGLLLAPAKRHPF
jgi:hypothetical protein